MNTGIIVQARVNSTRFPKKIFKKLYANYSVLDFLLLRIKDTKFVQKFILAVPRKDKSQFKELAEKYNFELFEGSEENVLKRFYYAARKYDLDIIIRVTSDSPIISSKILENSIKEFKQRKIDYYNNIIIPSYPHGIHIEILNFKSLQLSYVKSKNKAYKEHVTPFIYNNPNSFKIYTKVLKKKLNNFRLTIDHKKDLEILSKIIKISKKGTKVTYQDLIKILKKNKKILSLTKKFESRFYINSKN